MRQSNASKSLYDKVINRFVRVLTGQCDLVLPVEAHYASVLFKPSNSIYMSEWQNRTKDPTLAREA